MSFKLSDSSERASFFTWISSLGSHWQENPTPFEIIRKMVSKTSLNDKHILVLFNIEFLHILIDEQGVSPQDITFIADNHIEMLSANKIFKVQSYKLSDYTVPALKNLIVGLDMKFDLVFSNPPYNDSIDIKIINELLPYGESFVVVHPSSWVFDMKHKTKIYDELKNKIQNNVRSLEIFNGNNIFDIQLFVPITVTHIDNSYKGEIEIKYFGDNYVVSSINQVTKYGASWENNVSNLFEKIIEYVESNGNIWSHIAVDKDNNEMFYCQLADIRGTPNRSKNSDTMLLDDFYTMVQKKHEANYGIRKKEIKTTFAFASEKEMQNFISYLQTDFARFCLSFFKNSQNLHRGELEIIPWLDFTEEWDDGKLFKKFKVSPKLQDYIKEFLPDFHGIRK